jgi:hypothetical protein
MARPNLLSKSLPRVELDHRARDARLRLVRIERLFVPRAAMPDFRLSTALPLLGSRTGDNGRRGGRGAGRRATRASAVCVRLTRRSRLTSPSQSGHNLLWQPPWSAQNVFGAGDEDAGAARICIADCACRPRLPRLRLLCA